MLYHGTTVQGLKCIKANSKSHASDEKVAYFTEDRVYALVCCRTADHNFVTLGLREDGKLHYFERFPNQLEILYKNQKGYLYLIETNEGLINTKGHTWESSDDVMTRECEVIDDVYTEILKEEKKGNVVVHRYAEIDPAEQKMHANYIKEHMDEESDMKHFYMLHFAALWD